MAGREAGAADGVLRARLRRAGADVPAQATAPVPAASPPSAERMAATAAARAARRAAGLSATADSVAAQGISLSELPELLPERALIAVVEAGGDRLGVAALCPSLLAALIEMQAIGRVTARPVEARRPTRADAALAAGFVNHLLEEFGQALAGLPGQGALSGYRYASHLDDARPLLLMLEDGGFRALRVELRLGAGGERRGTLFVAVPAKAEGAASDEAASRPQPVAGIAAAGPTPTTAAPASLAGAMRHAPVPLVGVLCRRQISLRELRNLRPGATIALPRAVLDGAWLETLRGQKLARAKLGEAEGFHALRLRHRDDTSDHGAEAIDRNPAPENRLPATLAAMEPPIGDLAAPDAFRPDGRAFSAPVLPLPATSA